MTPAPHDAPVIMVVEPDVLVRMSVSQYLRECGFRVIEGITPHDVHSVLEAGARLDIVFADVRLHGAADGFALAQTLRQTHPAIDVILTAGLESAADKTTDLCHDGPIKKPYHPQDVHARIKTLLERRRAANELT